jgi:uncharacterized protein (TIRG00374 family)
LSDGPRSKKLKYVSIVIRTSVAVIALVWVFRGQDWNQLVATFANLNPWYFILALGVFTVTQILIGLRWWLLMRAQRIYVGFWAVVRLHFLGLFYNNFMPGSVGGDFLKAWYVTKHTERKLQGALSVFVDRLIGLLSMLIMALFSYLLLMRDEAIDLSSQPRNSFFVSVSAYKWALLSIFLGTVALISALSLNKTGRRIMAKLWTLISSQGLKAFKKARESVLLYCRNPLTILAAFALTILIQSTVIISLWFLGQNLKIAAGARYYFVIFPLTWVAAALPVSIAGMGILEVGLRELFTRFAHAGVEQAVALALCQRFIWMLASLPGAAIHLIGAHLPKDFSIDGKEATN